MTTETKEPQKIDANDPLAGIEQIAPDKCQAKTRLYLCGIRKTEEFKRFEFQIGVGPVTFSSETFRWHGVGENAKQIFNEGSLHRLTDAQVEEVRRKMKFMYLRKVKNKAGEIQGVQQVDASDGGAKNPPWALNQGAKDSESKFDPTRLNGTETPLVQLVFMKPTTESLDNLRSMTLEQLKELVAQMEADAEREVADETATFSELEGGKGGLVDRKAKSAGTAAPRDAAAAIKATTTDGKRKADAGFIPDGK